MYDITRRIKLEEGMTVGKLIDELQNLPNDAEVLICGDDKGFIHVERDGSAISIDTEDLDEEYIEDPETSAEAYWGNR